MQGCATLVMESAMPKVSDYRVNGKIVVVCGQIALRLLPVRSYIIPQGGHYDPLFGIDFMGYLGGRSCS